MNKLKHNLLIIFLVSSIFFCSFSFENKNKEAVIFVHGIMGNCFTNGDHRVWPPRIYGEKGIKAIIYGPKMFSDVNYLSLNDKGEPLYNLDIMKDNNRNVIFNEYYKDLKEAINNTKRYEFIYFPYDWRLPCDYNSDKLKDFIGELKSRGYKKVSMIGYSMGGIVTLNALDGINEGMINKVITLSTPYLGSPKSIYSISTGIIGTDIGQRVMSLKLNSMIKNFSSIYDLFPLKDYKKCYMETQKGLENKELISYEDINSFLSNEKFINNELYSKGTVFGEDRVNKLLNQIKNNKYYLIVGSGVGTVGKLKFKSDTFLGGDRFHDFELVDGDGEVPSDSLSVNKLIPKDRIFYTNVAHENMSRNQYVIKRVIDILDDKTIDFMRTNDIRGAEEGQILLTEPIKANKMKITISGDNQDKYKVHLYDSSNNHSGFISDGVCEKKIKYSNILINEQSVIISAMEDSYLLRIEGNDDVTVGIKIIWYDEENNKTIEKTLENVRLDKNQSKVFDIYGNNIKIKN